MKLFYPLFRGLIKVPLITLALVQQYVWWTTGCVNSTNRVITILWFFGLVLGTIAFANACFPKQDPTIKHKFKCTFYSLARKGKYVRMCTRTYPSIWSYCFKQARQNLAVFTIVQLD